MILKQFCSNFVLTLKILIILSKQNENTPTWQFMILDGPVDTFWVENLNSVLDDSKVLCLSNGERINMTPTIRIVFEVDSLVHTSPATVSRQKKFYYINLKKFDSIYILRCAMVYFEPVDLGLTPLIRNWINSLPKDFPQIGIDLINELLDFSLEKGRLIFNYFLKNFL